MAVLDGEELRYWGVTRFRQKEMDDLLAALERRLVRLILLYRPAVLAIENPMPVRLHASPWLEKITARIRATARASSLRVYTCNPIRIRKCLCGSARATRKELAQQIVETYPHLSRYRTHSSRWKEHYWMQMFAAVAVGLVCNGG